jgi:two-component system LytT family response regulator
MLKVILVDDEANVRKAIAQMLELYHPEVEIVASCPDLSTAIIAIKEKRPDVLLLDIEIGHENGFDIFKVFSKPAFKVIFVTAFQQYAIQAFRFAALDYLLKPIDPDMLSTALSKASGVIDHERLSLKIDSFMHNMSNDPHKSKRIVLKTTENVYVVDVNDIMYCEADGPYTKFYLADNNRILVSLNMGHYEDLFSPQHFFRIHQSYLLNLGYLARYDKADSTAILKNGAGLPVASRKKDLFLQRLSQL